jgi:signal transduction histidine kinase
VVQAEAGEALLPDVDASGRALRSIQAAGRATLAELRQLLGTLDGDSADSDSERFARLPSPRLIDAHRLIEQLRNAGLDVRLHVDGPAVDLPAGVDIAAYRVLQESLTNALRHGGGRSVVATLRIDTDDVVGEVVDQGPAGSTGQLTHTGAGHGLAGMRERVSVYGGEMESGPTGDGFRVRARIPVHSRG